MAQVKFYRGKKEDYVLEEHMDGVYFATNTEEVVMNGKEYGKDPDWNEIETKRIVAKWNGGTATIEILDINDRNTETLFPLTSPIELDSNKILRMIRFGNELNSIDYIETDNLISVENSSVSTQKVTDYIKQWAQNNNVRFVDNYQGTSEDEEPG